MLFLVAIFGLNQHLSAADSGAATIKPQKISQKSASDSAIEGALQAKLAKSKLAADHFTVSVSGGVATIEGTTGVMQHKGVMTRMAKSAGATAVRNNIRISDAARAKATASLAKSRPKARNAPAAEKPVQDPQVPRAKVLPPIIGR